MTTEILLIRHGETAWNRSKIFRGTYDIELNDTGKAQAGLVSKVFAKRKIDAAYSSPLSRAIETAQISLIDQNIKPVIEDGLIDINYGDWTGKEEGEIAQQWPDEHEVWSSEPHKAQIPAGETLQSVYDRAFGAMEAIVARHQGQRVALFAHRVVNKVLVLGALGLGLSRFKFIIQDNCCVNEFTRNEEGYLIRSVNNTSHIAGSNIEMLTSDF
jgi:broad specificity phosphatase PhoE